MRGWQIQKKIGGVVQGRGRLKTRTANKKEERGKSVGGGEGGKPDQKQGKSPEEGTSCPGSRSVTGKKIGKEEFRKLQARGRKEMGDKRR